MKHALQLTISLLAMTTILTAQSGDPARKPDGKPPMQEAKKDAQEGKGAKDDPAMAKDPAIIAIDKAIKKANVNTKVAGWRTQLQAPPLAPFDPKTEYFWHMETTKGELVLKLFPDTAPMHVTSGIYLARLGFYDGLKFHRILKGFMAQGGCPQGTGGGGPGYQLDGEFYGNRAHDKPGVLSTANTGMPKSDGSQFFLTFVPTPHLDGKHTIWGEVVEGMDALKELEAAGTSQDGARMADPPSIVRSWISIRKNAPAKDKPAAKDDKKPGEQKS